MFVTHRPSSLPQLTEFGPAVDETVKHVESLFSISSGSLGPAVLERSKQIAANIFAVLESRQREAYDCHDSDTV